VNLGPIQWYNWTMSKPTAPAAIDTDTCSFTKDEMLCTAFVPELGHLRAQTPNYHSVARFNTKEALIEQLAWMHPDRDEPFWKMLPKQALAVAVASRLEQVGILN